MFTFADVETTIIDDIPTTLHFGETTFPIGDTTPKDPEDRTTSGPETGLTSATDYKTTTTTTTPTTTTTTATTTDRATSTDSTAATTPTTSTTASVCVCATSCGT